ncbi:MAG: hypothetical protein J0H08_17985, partial [Rhizobiales bacterium]|nr:hypothetical protein [Hyphomicrobiales bacterium]
PIVQDDEEDDETKVLEKSPEKPKKQKVLPPPKPSEVELPLWLSDDWSREWLESEPRLAEVDLRPYFYFSRDTLGQVGVVMPRLSPLAQIIITELFDASEAVRQNALVKAKDLNPDEAASVFEALTERVHQEEDRNDERSALRRCFDWAKARPELVVQLLTFLESLPVKTVPTYAVVGLNDLPDSDEKRRYAKRIAGHWAEQKENLKLQGIAQYRLKDFKD